MYVYIIQSHYVISTDTGLDHGSYFFHLVNKKPSTVIIGIFIIVQQFLNILSISAMNSLQQEYIVWKRVAATTSMLSGLCLLCFS